MQGIINVLKPTGMTSFDVVSYLRGLLKIKKIGHIGTLDPNACGVLPICVGRATKAIQYMMEYDKVYRAELTLGITTDTQDIWGQEVNTYDISEVTNQHIKDAIMSFVGKYYQIPPMYSAKKINGDRLYDLARKGINIDRSPVLVDIYSIKIIKINEKKQVLFDVYCKKGTYIRTLCHDIGQKLGVGGVMSFLLRKRVGIFDINNSNTLLDIKESISNNSLDLIMYKLEQIFTAFKEVTLDEVCLKRFLNGVQVELDDGFKIGELVKISDKNSKLLAIGEIVYNNESIFLKQKTMF